MGKLCLKEYYGITSDNEAICMALRAALPELPSTPAPNREVALPPGINDGGYRALFVVYTDGFGASPNSIRGTFREKVMRDRRMWKAPACEYGRSCLLAQ
jgi:hypothetical protein